MDGLEKGTGGNCSIDSIFDRLGGFHSEYGSSVLCGTACEDGRQRWGGLGDLGGDWVRYDQFSATQGFGTKNVGAMREYTDPTEFVDIHSCGVYRLTKPKNKCRKPLLIQHNRAGGSTSARSK